MSYRQYFLALLGVNLLILVGLAVAVLAGAPAFERILTRVRQAPVVRWQTEVDKHQLYARHQPEGAILMVGGSHTALADWPALTGDARLCNRGIQGETADLTRKRLSGLLATEPAALCLQVGIHDLIHYQRPASSVLDHVRAMAREAKQAGVPILIESVLPTRFDASINQKVNQLNTGLAEVAKEHGGLFVDLTPILTGPDGRLHDSLTTDGLHLNARGYERWAQALLGQLPPAPSERGMASLHP